MTRGAVRLIYPGTQLADAAFPPDGWWQDFLAMGRYISTPTNNLKNLTLAEIDRAADMGHGFMWFVEQSENTPINNTTDDDRRLADQSCQLATDRGLPDGTPHMYAIDTDGRPYMDQIRAAFVTYRQRTPAKWPIWAYAGSDVIDQLIADGLIDGGHIAAALSWSSTTRPVDNVTVFQARGFRWYKTPAASLFQYPSEAYRGGRIDRNDVINHAIPVWFPGDQVGPPLPDPGDIVLHGSPVNYISCNAGAQGHHIDGTVYQCPVNGTVFRCLPGGLIQWVPDGNVWATMNSVYGITDGNAPDYIWNVPVGNPDVFGVLVGPVPGRPQGWQDPHQVNVTTETVNVTNTAVDNAAIAQAVRDKLHNDPLK